MANFDEEYMFALIIGAVLFIFLILLGLRLCYHRNSSGTRDCKQVLNFNNHAEPVSSLELNRDLEIGKFLPCLHCQLIEMGEICCYQEFCPHCGRVAPGKL